MKKTLLIIISIFINFNYINIESFAKSYIREHEIAINNSERVYSIYDKKNNNRGAATLSGELIIPIKYNSITSILDNNILAVDKEKKRTIYTANGDILIPPIYDNITPLNGHFLVEKNEKFGLLNTKNETVFPIKYKSIESRYYRNSNEYILQENNKITYLKNGESINIPYDSANFYYYNKDYIIVYKNNKKGLYSIELNKYVIPALYDNIEYSSASYVFIVRNDNKYGIYEPNGKVIYKTNLKDIENIYGKIIVKKENDKYDIYAANKKIKILEDKEFIKFARNDGNYGNIFYVKDNDKFGIIKWNSQNNNIEIIVPYIYDDIDKKGAKYTLAKLDNKWYAINIETGEINKERIFDLIIPSKKYYNDYITIQEISEVEYEEGIYNLSIGKYYNSEILKKERKKDFLYAHPKLSLLIYGPPLAAILGIWKIHDIYGNITYNLKYKRKHKIKIKDECL